jgi:hypothetical protein
MKNTRTNKYGRGGFIHKHFEKTPFQNKNPPFSESTIFNNPMNPIDHCSFSNISITPGKQKNAEKLATA